MTTRTLDRPGGLTPPILITYLRTRLLERFATDRPGVMGCLYRHVGDDAQGVRWEVVSGGDNLHPVWSEGHPYAVSREAEVEGYGLMEMTMNELINQVHCMDFEELCDAIEPQSIDLIASDLPYGQTQCTWDKRVDFDILWRCVKRVLKPRGVFLTTASEPFASLLRVSNLDWYKYDWVWVKSRSTGFLDANRKPLSNYENVLVFYDKQPDFNPQKTIGKPNHVSLGSKSAGEKTALYGGYVPQISKYTIDKYPNKVIEFNSIDPTQSIHNTQKPVPLYEYLIRTYTQPGDLVLDPFAGSGTTGLAALRTGRHYILGDSDAGYVEAARQRIQTADPMQDSILADGVTQLSLFS